MKSKFRPSQNTSLDIGLVGAVRSADGSVRATALTPIEIEYNGETQLAVINGIGQIDAASDWSHPTLAQVERIANKLAK